MNAETPPPEPTIEKCRKPGREPPNARVCDLKPHQELPVYVKMTCPPAAFS
jgi:hypothetical protein